MPQLDTIYIFLIFSWTWLLIYLMTQKIKIFLLISKKKNQQTKPNLPHPTHEHKPIWTI